MQKYDHRRLTMIRESDGVPTFRRCGIDAPRATALLVGAALSLAFLSSVYAAGPPQAHVSAPHQRDITDDLIAQFDRADVVALGEVHGSREDSDLRIRLIHHVDFPKKVRYIMVEFGNSLHQEVLDRYIRGGDVPTTEIQRTWRDITTPGGADSSIYAQFLREVRSVNKGLADGLKVRVLAGDPPIEWDQIKGPDDWRRIASTRDSFAAELLGREVLQKGNKALLIYGAGHVWRNARGGPIPADSTLVRLSAHWSRISLPRGRCIFLFSSSLPALRWQRLPMPASTTAEAPPRPWTPIQSSKPTRLTQRRRRADGA